MENEDPDDPNSDSNTFKFLIYRLGASGGGELADFQLANFKSLTREQSKAIAHFLEFEAEREDVLQAEYEQLRREAMAKDGCSQEEIEAAAKAGRFRIGHDPLDNDARRALERYWGQFL